MIKKTSNSSSGFIVHPFETINNKYHASYGRNKNKTIRSFKTLKQAKEYLRSKGVSSANYDSPSGYRKVKMNKPIIRRIRKPMRRSLF